MGVKGQRGGAQPGAGRKKKVDEEFARKIVMKAIIKKWGSLEAGVEAVMAGNDEKIKLFMWQHAFGVPEVKQKVKLSDSEGDKLQPGVIDGNILRVEVVRTVHNKDVQVNGSDNNSSRLPDVQ